MREYPGESRGRFAIAVTECQRLRVTSCNTMGFEVSMTIRQEQFVVDKEGNRIGVVLNIEDYQKLLADVEEL